MLMKYTHPPEGGWGWAVTFTSFLTYAVVWTVPRSFSVLFTDFQEEFQCTNSATSWITSLILGFLACGTLFGSMVTSMTGPRVTMMLGGIISCIGSFIISQASTLLTAYAGSIITGIGFGFAYCSASSQIGVYFNRKRSLAYGIASLGSPANGMLYPVVLLYLTQEYGWRGAVFITSGMCLHLLIGGSLLRPVEIIECPNPNRKTSDNQFTITIPLTKKLASEVGKSSPKLAHSDKYHVKQMIDQELLNKLRYPDVDTTQFLQALSVSTENINIETFSVRSTEEAITRSLPQLSHRQDFPCERDLKKQSMYRKALLTNAEKLFQHKETNRSNFSSDEATSVLITSCTIENSSINRNQNVQLKGSYFRRMRLLIQPYSMLLTEWRFMLYALAGFLDFFARLVPATFIVVHVQSLHISKENGAYLLVIFSIFDSIIRPISGYSTSRISQQKLKQGIEIFAFGGAQVVMGIANLLAPLATQFNMLAIYMSLYGITNGLNSSWCFPILTRLVPIERLHHAIGVFHFFCGIALFTGPPLAGYLADLNNSYDVTFFFSGAILLLSGTATWVLYVLLQKYGIRKINVILQKTNIDE